MTSAGELLNWIREKGSTFSEDELDRIEDLKARSDAPEDKWKS